MLGVRNKSYIRKRNTGRIVFALLLLTTIILFLVGQGRQNHFSNFRATVQDTTSPVMTFVSMPVRGFENFISEWGERSKAHEENQHLKAELARLRDIEAHANSLAFKISRFETILNVDTSSDIPDHKIAARAVTELNGPFVRSILINAGANKNIEVGNAVMTVDGLLGHVVQVGNRSARVLRLEDLNSRISVMSARSQARAILRGNNSAFPTLSFIAESADWDNGDEVVTSGDAGVLPMGLPVGKLTMNEQGDMTVSLFVNKNYVDWVWVYPYNELLKPEDDPLLESDHEAGDLDEQSSHVNIGNENLP